MKNTNTILVVIIILLVAGFLFYNSSNTEATTINVNGQSTIKAEADEVSVYVGIETTEKTSEESKNANAKISDNVLVVLKTAGIPEGDIETSSYYIYPEYDWSNNKQELVGYRTSNVLKITTKDFDKVGAIVDSSVDAGATTIQSINFELSQDKQNEVKTQAISKATEDAKVKAEATAQGLNAKLGKVKTVTIQDYNYYPFPIYASADDGAALDVKEVARTAIQPSSLDVSSTVNVVFEIDQ